MRHLGFIVLSMLSAEFTARDGACEIVGGSTEHLSLVFPVLVILGSHVSVCPRAGWLHILVGELAPAVCRAGVEGTERAASEPRHRTPRRLAVVPSRTRARFLQATLAQSSALKGLNRQSSWTF